jgi:uncharacterized protein
MEKSALVTSRRNNYYRITLLSFLMVISLHSFSQKSEPLNRIVLSHGYPGDSATAWYPFIEVEMKKMGFEVAIPNLPEPDLKAWQEIIKPLADKSPKNTILIGHSIGCVNLLKYLEQNDNTSKFPLLILVAPPAFNPGYESLTSFFSSPLDYDKIKNRVDNIVVFLTLQDKILTPDPMQHATIYVENLDAKLIILPAGGHFASFNNVSSLPEIIEEIRLVE